MQARNGSKPKATNATAEPLALVELGQVPAMVDMLLDALEKRTGGHLSLVPGNGKPMAPTKPQPHRGTAAPVPKDAKGWEREAALRRRRIERARRRKGQQTRHLIEELKAERVRLQTRIAELERMARRQQAQDNAAKK